MKFTSNLTFWSYHCSGLRKSIGQDFAVPVFIDDLFLDDAKCAHQNHHATAKKQNQVNEQLKLNDVKLRGVQGG